ncbi:type II toxin-antitoxin system PemK/MazF family toxin [Anoxybacteroides tepidamans]|uniref:type II toxin-antitoxin system PemK/MazF family toxin n=1 Tax=Anoxybacteroides tepidamans TaxID=265948 RepID=UPI000486ACE6|nr:type II toxin-antitoxin system PemK/MazF family toxin [Anoxybacillus tepidamans]
MVSGINYSEIKRGHIYLAAIAYSDGRPLNFFEPMPDLGENIGKVVTKPHGFEAETDERGIQRAKEVSVIVKHKARLAVVLQNDLFNSNEDYHHVYVAPIATIHPSLEKSDLIKRLKEKNDIPQLHYIGEHTGRPAYINIGDIKRIHKSLLLEKKGYPPIDNDQLNIIGEKICTLLEIKRITQSEEIQDFEEAEQQSS